MPELPAEEVDKLPLSTQIDLWFGQRHRFWYFLSGIVVTVGVLWAIYFPFVREPERRTYDKVYSDQLEKIANLQTAVEILTRTNQSLTDSVGRLDKNLVDTVNFLLKIQRDSLGLFHRLGTYWGTYDIPILSSFTMPGDGVSLLGKLIQAVGSSQPNNQFALFVYVDTCSFTSIQDTMPSDCPTYSGYLPMGVDKVSPLKVGDNVFYILPKKIDGKTITIELYSNQQTL